MNYRKFISRLSKRASTKVQDTEKMVEALNDLMTRHFIDNDTLSISGFGVLEVRQRQERISVNPSTGERFVVPSKRVLTFKQSNLLKEKLNINPSADDKTVSKK